MEEDYQPGDAPDWLDPEFQFSVPYARHWFDPATILGNMPLLASQAEEHAGTTLEEFHFIFVLHFLRDLLGLMRAYRAAGLQPSKCVVLFKPYMYPNLEVIRRTLEADDYLVAPLRFADRVIQAQISEAGQGRGLIVVEDGGYIVPCLHHRFGDRIELCCGAVEQTARGINNDEELSPIRLPIYDVARCQWKEDWESPEIARVAVDNIRRLISDVDLRGRGALVIGYGRVGSRIANLLREDPTNMHTWVYDLDPRKRSAASRDGHWTGESLPDLIRDRDLPKVVIGATGETSIGRVELLSMPSGSYLVSISSDQIEIGVKELYDLAGDPRGIPVSEGVTRYRIQQSGHEILLVARGYPVNFCKVESLPNEVSDLVLTPIFKCTLDLAQKHVDLQPGVYTKEVDRLIDDQRLPQRYERHRSGQS